MSKTRVVVTVDVKGDWAPEDIMDTLRAACEGRIARIPIQGDILHGDAKVVSVRLASSRSKRRS